jgi:hypothetical protein
MEMSDLPNDLKRELARIQDCDDVKLLLDGLARDLEVTAYSVIRASARVRRLEELGVKIEVELNLPALQYLRRIAYGQMSAQLLVNCLGNDLLIEKASQLPMPDQERIARNEPLKVMTTSGSHRMVPAAELTQWEIKQVIGKGEIRGDGKQVGWLRERLDKEAARGRPSEEPEVFEDLKEQCLIVRGLKIPAAQLAQHLARLTSKTKTR